MNNIFYIDRLDEGEWRIFLRKEMRLQMRTLSILVGGVSGKQNFELSVAESMDITHGLETVPTHMSEAKVTERIISFRPFISKPA